jgi:large subunit ribosomal protein L10
MSKTLKEMMAADLRGRIASAGDFLVVALKPLDSEKTANLRRTLRSQGALLRQIHNRTARYALGPGQEPLSRHFKGPTAVALGRGEMVPVARAVLQAQREDALEVRGGWVDGEVLDAAGVSALSLSPDKPTLRAMICGAINGPARGIAASLQAVAGGIARCLQARVDKSGEPVS